MRPLAKREKLAVCGGTGFLVLLLTLQWVLRPALERASTLRRVVAEKQEILVQLRAKSQEYKQLEAEVGQLRSSIGRQGESRKIFSMIERLRQAAGLPDDALSMKPTTTAIDKEYEETMVEISLDGVTLAQLVAFLSQLESSGLPGGVKSLDIGHAGRGPGALKATVQLVAVACIGRT
ncbi:MAG: type II secretion system protein M [Sedimentisphaerales bacterium]|nr:type II secretion system protein M [Sedimentisphaerales bacterium]